MLFDSRRMVLRARLHSKTRNNKVDGMETHAFAACGKPAQEMYRTISLARVDRETLKRRSWERRPVLNFYLPATPTTQSKVEISSWCRRPSAPSRGRCRASSLPSPTWPSSRNRSSELQLMRVITSVVITCKLQGPRSYDLRKEVVTFEFARILRCAMRSFLKLLSINRKDELSKRISSTIRFNSTFPTGNNLTVVHLIFHYVSM